MKDTEQNSQASTSSSRIKGAVAEQQLFGLLNNQLGVTPSGVSARSALTTRWHHAMPITILCRDRQVIRLQSWWQETIQQAEKEGRIPVLAYTDEKKRWRFRLPVELLTGSHWTEQELAMTAELHIEGFCAIARELWIGG
uniref:Uncharacterized protein n=1 Tax=Magnetococcus massalia (strain MO-1) TaxID=451514 RepID=A0A1S7LF97_MAGMO|nr:protein of unknown function [Candidatus Magnetococcus massalia]